MCACLGREKDVEFGKWALRSPLVRMLSVNGKMWQAAWEIFVKYDDKGFPSTDCTSFALMQRVKLHEAFTFDDHLKQMGFVMVPFDG